MHNNEVAYTAGRKCQDHEHRSFQSLPESQDNQSEVNSRTRTGTKKGSSREDLIT